MAGLSKHTISPASQGGPGSLDYIQLCSPQCLIEDYFRLQQPEKVQKCICVSVSKSKEREREGERERERERDAQAYFQCISSLLCKNCPYVINMQMAEIAKSAGAVP